LRRFGINQEGNKIGLNGRLNGYDNGFGSGEPPIGSVLALSGRVTGATRVRARDPLGRGADRLDHAGRVQEEEAGWAEPDSAQ
jgi:hypothetical protein